MDRFFLRLNFYDYYFDLIIVFLTYLYSFHFLVSSIHFLLYCNNIYEHSKTCQEIGAMITYNEKLKKDEINALYRKTLSAKKMLANRNLRLIYELNIMDMSE